MKKFVSEYGRLVIAIIALIGFFTLLGVILSKNITNPKSIYGIFNVHAQDSSAVYDGEFYESVIGDVVESNTAPYFKISHNPNFGILENQIDWNRLFQDVRMMYNGIDVTDMDIIDGQEIQKSVIVYEYKPSIIEATGTDLNGHIEMEEVYAKDKYGHYIYQDANGYYNNSPNYNPLSGKKVTITQPKFLTSDGIVFTKSNYIDCSAASEIDNTRQYKVIYRMQIGKLKAECSVNYIKNRVGTDINVSGKSKIVFNYN